MADVFAIPDFWKLSQWASDAALDSAQDFFKADVGDGFEQSIKLDTVDNPSDFFSKPLELPEAAKNEPSASIPHEIPDLVDLPSEASSSAQSTEFWLDRGEDHAHVPELKTWMSFTKPERSNLATQFLSEAGPTAFDVLFREKHSEAPVKKLKVAVLLSSLLGVALGHESALFSWDESNGSFQTAKEYEHGNNGCSRKTLGNITRLCVDCGTSRRQLQAFVDEHYRLSRSATCIAFAKVLQTIASEVQEELVAFSSKLRSLAQLHSTVSQAHGVMQQVMILANKSREVQTDEQLVSLLFEELRQHELNTNAISLARRILQAVSRPWLDFVQLWIGAGSASQVIEIEVTGKAFVRANLNQSQEMSGAAVSKSYELIKDKMPAFITPELANSIFENGKNLRFLVADQIGAGRWAAARQAASVDVQLDWAFQWDDLARIERKAQEYQRALSAALAGVHGSVPGTASPPRTSQEDVVIAPEADFFDLAVLEAKPANATDGTEGEPHGKLQYRWLSSCTTVDSQTGTNDNEHQASPDWDVLSSLSFTPLIRAQAAVVNRECLRLIFHDQAFRQQLRLLKDYHLLGSGIFSHRLASALFDPELNTTERRKYIARSGGVMGLRLTTRENWPPAMSELRLTLINVLPESYEAEHGSLELPGDLSFSVRELSQAEIVRSMVQDSVEAVDFLRLSYKPPPTLLPVMTETILAKYDAVFRLLLRLLRLLFIVDELYQHRSALDPNNHVALRFRHEAHHLVTTFASYVLMSGINRAWKRFDAYLDKVECGNEESRDTLASGYKVPTLDDVRMKHEETLDEMRSSLLLQSQQQPVLQSLEKAFAFILRFARSQRQTRPSSDGAANTPQLYREFRHAVQTFISGCREQCDTVGADLEIADIPLAELMLTLDMSGYYAATGVYN